MRVGRGFLLLGCGHGGFLREAPFGVHEVWALLFFEGWIAACRVVKNLQFVGVEYADFTGLCRTA